MSHYRRLVALVLVNAMVVPALPTPARADERQIKCESRDNRYNFCSADTDDRVTLTRQLSKTRCVLWSNWGYDRRGVWVDRGCRAEFQVGKSGLSGGQTAAIVGGVAAAAVIAAIIASKKGDKTEKNADVPSWAVGTFRGWDEYAPRHD